MTDIGVPRRRQTTCGIFKCGATYDLPRVNTAVAGSTDRDKFVCCPRCGFSESDIEEAGTNSSDGIRDFHKRGKARNA